MVDRSCYNCVLSQQFSPCGNYLVCGNTFGDIVVYDLNNILSNSENPPDKGPNHSFTTPNHEPICSMTSTSQFLITGTVGVIYGWSWNSVTEYSPQVVWKISMSNIEKQIHQDVNSLFINMEEQVNHLYAGCGDNVIHVHSLEDGKFIRSFEGHTNYIHSISKFDNQMASGGEDGCVRLWDLRQLSMTAMVEPSTHSELARPNLGEWVGDVDLNSTYLLCGGGSQAGLWDLRMLGITTVFEGADGGLHVTKLLGDSVLLGGQMDYFFRLKTDGEELSRIESSSSVVYSAIFREEPHQVLSLAGYSQNIDLCKNYSERYKVLSFFDKRF